MHFPVQPNMACTNLAFPMTFVALSHRNQRDPLQIQHLLGSTRSFDLGIQRATKSSILRCSAEPIQTLRTCKHCKTQFDPLQNNPRACRYHTAHFGGETKRKFESVYTGGTLAAPESGKVFHYWHCCGSEDPFDLGCTAAPHACYDD